MPAAVKLFISYAKDNRQQWLLPVRQHLLGLQQIGLIEIWEDSRIDPGDVWDDTIAAALDAADIVLLLVSSAFTASEYCNLEMTRSLERQKDGSATVIWIYVENCDYEPMPFARLEGMPQDKNGRLQPLNEFNRKDRTRHLADAARRIRQLAVEVGKARGRLIAPKPLAELKAAETSRVHVSESLVAHAEMLSAEMGVPVEVLRSIVANLVSPAA